MLCKIPDNKVDKPATQGVGDAEGVADRKWFVAIVNNNTEKAAQERLEKQGYETYVAKQEVTRIWKNGRKRKVDKVLLPTLVFIKCTERERKEIVTLPYINRFMTNKAGASTTSATKPLATIPQKEIETMRFMLGQSDIPVTFVETPYKINDRVVIVRGSLRGLEGEVVGTIDGKSHIVVRIDILGTAKVAIDPVNLQPEKN